MDKLTSIWLEKNSDGKNALRIDWDNDRHQRIALNSGSATDLALTLRRAAMELDREVSRGNLNTSESDCGIKIELPGHAD